MSTFFFSIMLLILFLCLMARWIDQVIINLKFILNLTPMLIFTQYILFEDLYAILILLGRSQMDLMCPLCFLGNNRQHMPICAKIISSWVRKFLNIAKANVSPGTPCRAAISAALVAGGSLVSILHACVWTRVLFQLNSIFQHISLLQIGTGIQFSLVSWALVSSQPVGMCQTLICIKSCRYVGLSG